MSSVNPDGTPNYEDFIAQRNADSVRNQAAEITRLTEALAEAIRDHKTGIETLASVLTENERLTTELTTAQATIANIEGDLDGAQHQVAIHEATIEHHVAYVQVLEATIAQMREALDWITAPHTDISHIVFRQEAKIRAEEACRVDRAALASPAEKEK